MTRSVHYTNDPRPPGERETNRSVCGLVWEAGMRFADEPERVTCHRACGAAADRERKRLLALRDRAVGARLVFLDFDGVLNHQAFFDWRKSEREKGSAEVPWLHTSFDRACVARLNRLLEASGALVVVSSTWRLGSTVPRLQALLEGYGFTGMIAGKTPESRSSQRGDEIRAWIDVLPAPPSAFVVIDDDSDMDAVRDRFVQTLFHGGGLTDAKVDEALRVLGVSP